MEIKNELIYRGDLTLNIEIYSVLGGQSTNREDDDTVEDVGRWE